MRYWLYLTAKLAGGVGIISGLQFGVEHLFPIPPSTRYGPPPIMFMHDLTFTFAIFAVWLIGAGLLAIIVWDHRRRCRTCHRRLIMPLATGSWGHMVTFGRPKTEMICPFGHGTLHIEELQITGRQFPDWQPHDENIWKELDSYYQTHK